MTAKICPNCDMFVCVCTVPVHSVSGPKKVENSIYPETIIEVKGFRITVTGVVAKVKVEKI